MDATRFLKWDGRAQGRYEALRAHVLREEASRRVTPAQLSLGRVARFGVLGLLDHDPLGTAWGVFAIEQFQVELIPVGTADTSERVARLCAVLFALTTTPQGENHVARSPVRQSVDRNARERADHSEPVGGYLAVR